MNRPQDRGRCAARHQAHDCKKRDPPPLPSKRVPLKPGHIPSAPDPNQPAKKTARNRQRAARRKNRRQNTRHNRQLRILQQNIAGFKSRRVELLKRLSDLKVDVAAIQEANFSVKTVNGKETHVIPEIRGWNVVAQERKTGRKTGSNSAGRGGVAWLIREGINYDILKTPPTIQNDNTTEWVGIRVYQEKNNHVVDFKDLYNLYVPPIHESSKDDNRKQNFKTTKLPVTENTLFFGDVNCHGTWDDRIAANDMAEMWEDWLTNNDFSYMNTPFSHTRKDSNGRKSSPDISIIHNKLLDKYSWTPQERNPGGSDHLPILITLTLEHNNKRRSRKCKGQTRWAHKKAHWDLFKYFVEIDLKSWFTEDEKPSALKDMSAKLNSSIINAAKKSIPRGNRPNIKPFWNEAIDEATKESNEARANCHLSDAHAQAYKLARENLTKVTAEAREESWQKFVTELDPKTDPGKVWKTIAAMDGRKPKTRSGTSIKMGDKTATTDQQKAKLFNQSYHLESRIVKDKKADKPTIKAHRAAVKECSYCSGQRTGMCCPFTKEELKTAMTRLKSGKSPGEDKITNNMLVRLPPIGKEALLYLYNKSWETKTCPKEWKSAVIVTLPKPGKDPSLTTSYRPISLLSTISKLMERLVQQRLQDFLERGKKLYPGQAGFRKGRSTTEQIQRLVQMISDNNQNRLKTTVVYVDFTKAYDKVWRDRLWMKMGQLNIPACVIKWVKALLSDRYARVRYNNSTSSKLRYDNGLPQGSVLAPLLWLIYINDLPDTLKTTTQLGVSSSLFADDVAITASGKTKQECERKLQPALDALANWCKDNKVTISTSKTVCCLYTKDNKEKNGNSVPNLTINGCTVQHEVAPKFLGVYIDQGLTFKAHASHIAGKASKRNKILRALSARKWGQKTKTLKALHQGYTQAAIDHGIGAWGIMASQSTLETVSKKEREAARIITGCTRDTPKTALMREAGLTPTRSRAEIQATLQHERSTRLPPETPSRQTEESYAPLRLKRAADRGGAPNDKLLPPRETAWKTLCQANLECIPKEPTLLNPSLEPWKWDFPDVEFNTVLEGCSGKSDTQEHVTHAYLYLMENVKDTDIVCFTDGSAMEGTKNGGAGATVEIPGDEKITVKEPCGIICSSFRAEMKAIETALQTTINNLDTEIEFQRNMWVITDSLSAITALSGGPGSQYNAIGSNIWELLNEISRCNIKILFQWIPGHRGIPGNEEADMAAGEASLMAQEQCPIDFQTTKCAVKRKISSEWLESAAREPLFFNKVTDGAPLELPNELTRQEETTIHQLRTGKSPLAAHCLTRYAGLPDNLGVCLAGCDTMETVEHLISCPMYTQPRNEVFGHDNVIKDLNSQPKKILKFLQKIKRDTPPSL